MAARALLCSSSKRKQACTSTKRRRPIKSPPRAGLNLLLVGMGPSRRLRASPAGCRGFRKAFFAPPNVLARWQVMIHARRPGQLARAKGHRHARRLPQAVLCACVACKGCMGGSEMIRNYAVWIIYGYIDAANSYNYIQRYIIIYSKIRIII